MATKDPEKLLASLCALPAETEWAEFKMNMSSPDTLGRYVSALSNAAILAGRPHAFLVFGVDDATHEVKGTEVNISKQKKGSDTILFWINKTIRPRLNIEHISFTVDEKKIEILKIDPAYSHPVRFNGTAFTRVNSSLSPLSEHPEKERAIWQAVNRFSFEASNAATHMEPEEIDDKIFTKELVVGLSSGRAEGNLIEYLCQEKLVSKNMESSIDVTNLLVISACRDFSDWTGLEKKGIRLVVYKGVDKLDSKSDNHGKRGYFMAFDNVLVHIMSNINSKEDMASGTRKKIYDIPSVSIREILANAIVHQDLTISGNGPLVEIFLDRVVITNPGKPLIEVSRFIDQPSWSRNASFTDLMRRLGICEERGSGIDRAFSEIETAGLPPPLVKVVGNSTVVTLFGPRSFADMTPEERVRGCYQHASLGVERSSFMSNATLRKRFRLTDKQYPQASRVIRETVEAKLIRPLSEGQSNKNARYVPFWYD